MTVITARVGSDKYPTVISVGALSDLLAFCGNYTSSSALVVCDQYFQSADLSLYSELSELFKAFPTLFVSGGVESKGLSGYQTIIEWVISKKLPRDGILIAIGGGVIGDLVAFAASTYLRGVGLVHVPTTTTSMIDSAIGGKTGLNFDSQVNSIGTYYNPNAVFMDIRFLLTLGKRDYFAGICEAIKMSLTSSFERTQILLECSRALSYSVKDESLLLDLIIWSVKTKLYHVSDDAKEKSIRLILNYGHTFGQAFETYYGLHQDYLRHGEAVSLGMICASTAINILDNNEKTAMVKRLTKELLEAYELPTCIMHISGAPPSSKTLYENLINDKKRTSKGNRFILTPSIGDAEIRYISDDDAIKQSFAVITG